MAKKKQSKTEVNETQVSVDEFLNDGQASVNIGRERPKGRALVSGASFHDFDKEPIFVGNYRSEVKREKDGPHADTNPNEKAGTVMGYLFEDELGKETIIGNSFAIKKALEDIKFSQDVTLWIEFQGKTTVKGKPFNRFHIQTVD